MRKNKIIKKIKLLLLSLLLIFSSTIWASEPYYGFYPSMLGENYKQLKHNIFNFAIDIPVQWTFGVNGQPPLSVILLYPETLDTSRISNNYETIEMGIIPAENITLKEAYCHTILGMHQAHPNLKILKQPEEKLIQNNNSLEFTFEWQSKTGFTVVEWVNLVNFKNRVYSVTSRAAKGIFTKNKDSYSIIINTFTPIEAVPFNK